MSAGASIFGTDGIRDRAGAGLLSSDSVRRIVDATCSSLASDESFECDFPGDRRARRRLVIGRDTRASGESLERLMGERFAARGFDVVLLGVVPTPGVAHVARILDDAVLGIMISASHNPAEYNGIKFLAPTGAKMSNAFEAAVSEAYHDGRVGPSGQGSIVEDDGRLVRAYVESLVASCRHPERTRGRRIAVDCANGATYRVARQVFEELGAELTALGDAPDGGNINAGCGALHPEGLAAKVVSEGAFGGFAFDGDGDRMIPVTEGGRVLDGDYVMAITARAYRREGLLPAGKIISTVMSNIGLEKSLAAAGLSLVRTAVGDRFVYEVMASEGHPIGGEQSGHLIFLDAARTGDGILAALRLMDCVGESSLEEAAEVMRQYPQILLNYRVSERVPLESIDAVQRAVREVEDELGGDGRVVLRYSGTEPLARVMVEGPSTEAVERLARRVGAAIVDALGEG